MKSRLQSLGPRYKFCKTEDQVIEGEGANMTGRFAHYKNCVFLDILE